MAGLTNEEGSQTLRLVLLGVTGSGKSSTGNTILGQDLFRTAASFKSVTTTCQRQSAQRFGVTLEVVDTPGLLDTDMEETALNHQMVKCLGLTWPGPHALLLNVPIGRYTPQDALAIEGMRQLLGDDIMRHVIVLFTCGDKCEDVGELLREGPENLKTLLKDSGDRYVVFNNVETDSSKKDEQVEILLQKVQDLLASVDRQHFTSPLLETYGQTVLEHKRIQLLHEFLEDEKISEELRQVVREGLEANRTADRLLQQVLDQQEIHREEEKIIVKKLVDVTVENADLVLALDDSGALSNQLQRDLETEKRKRMKKGKCVIS